MDHQVPRVPKVLPVVTDRTGRMAPQVHKDHQVVMGLTGRMERQENLDHQVVTVNKVTVDSQGSQVLPVRTVLPAPEVYPALMVVTEVMA